MEFAFISGRFEASRNMGQFAESKIQTISEHTLYTTCSHYMAQLTF